MEVFEYEPIDLEGPAFRLLRLFKGRESNIECELFQAWLHCDNTTSYEALSYTWGGTETSKCIKLSGRTLGVTENLYCALWHLRSQDTDRILWVDAVCINQDDLNERSAQIQRMRNIYASARTVLAWTGEASNDSDAAIDLIQEIGQFMSTYGRDLPSVNLHPQHIRKDCFDPSTKNWEALWNFGERPYWSRIWVIQELAMCGMFKDECEDRCLIICGHRSVRKGFFDSIWQLLSLIAISQASVEWVRIGEPVRTIVAKGLPQAYFMFITLWQISDDKFQNIRNLMRTTESFEATDRRDKIYALLGLAREVDQALTPDYSKPDVAVFKNMIKFLVERDRDLESLLCNRTRTDGLGPSWTPELREGLHNGPCWFNCCGPPQRAAGSLDADVSFEDKNDLLIARGVRLGTMEKVIGPFTTSQGQRQENVTTCDTMSLLKATDFFTHATRLWKFARELPETLGNQVWRTLVMDRDHTNLENVIFPAPEEFGKMYRVFLRLESPPEDFGADLPPEDRPLRFITPFFHNWERNLANRCFFVTKCGKMGIGPYCSQPGDIIVVLFGSSFCFILRTKGEQYELIGDSYVHGAMNGEFVVDYANGDTSKAERFALC